MTDCLFDNRQDKLENVAEFQDMHLDPTNQFVIMIFQFKKKT